MTTKRIVSQEAASNGHDSREEKGGVRVEELELHFVITVPSFECGFDFERASEDDRRPRFQGQFVPFMHRDFSVAAITNDPPKTTMDAGSD